MKTHRVLLLIIGGLFTMSLKVLWISSVMLILYSIIARNWLYNANRRESIMSALESFGSQDNVRWNLGSKTNHCAEQSVLMVFKNILFVDEELKSSNENLKQTIDDFFKNKSIISLSQITATPVFSKPCVLNCYWIFIRHYTYIRYKQCNCGCN